MFKKHISILALSACLTLGAPAVFAEPADINQADQPVVENLADGQVALESDAPDSEETDVIEESSIARKMTQAEKAQNAKENDSWGGAITIIAMCIVLGALIILCLLFMGFGKISQSFMAKKKLDSHGITPDEKSDDHEDVDSGETIAAIAAALAEHFGQNHDMEDTILTIRRMKRTYSPWNSKIHGLRQVPEVTKNVR